MNKKAIDYLYRATLVRCVDGDTVDVDVDLGFYTSMRVRFRLEGIDTPERGQAGYKEATEYLNLLLQQGQIYVRSTKTGKYGRWLGTFFVQNININEKMVADGFAREY